jgi:hypothetical protein
MKVLVPRGDSGDRGETRSPIIIAPRAEKPRPWRVGALAALPPRPEHPARIALDRRLDPPAEAVEAAEKTSADRPSISAPSEPSEPAPAQSSSAPIRRGRVRRVQVERIAIRREAAEIWFNDGVTASAPRGPIAERLRAVERSGEMIDGLLADYGNGWVIEAVEAVSAEWRQIEITPAAPRLPSDPLDAMIAAVEVSAAGLEAAQGLELSQRSDGNT